MRLISAKTILGLSALLLTAACTDELAENPADGARPIAFTPAAETRAVVEGTTLHADFNVWGGYDNNATNVFNGVTVQFPNCTYTGGTQYWIPGKTYNFYGVYPTGVGSCNNGIITVDNFDCSKFGEEAVDLMTAVQPGLKGDDAPTVAMQFKHALTRITFSAKLADGLDVGYSLQVKEVALWASNKGDMTQDMSQADNQPSWTTEPYLKDGDDEGDINEEYNAYLYRLTTDGALQSTPIPTGNAVLLNVKGKGDLLVIPQEMNYTRPVLAINYTLSYGGSTTSPVWKVYPLKGNTDWTPGASLNYTFTIDEDNAYFTVSVGDWIDGNKGNEDVEFN